VATELATAWITLVPSLKGAQKTIEKDLDGVDVKGVGKRTGGRFGAAIGVGLIAASALIVKGLSDAVGKASTLEESLNAVSVSYGDNADAVKVLGEASASALGLSNADFNSLAVQFSAFTKTIAGDGGDVAGTLDLITGRASDFASVMDLDVAEAATMFQSGLAGETEPLRKFGIDLSAASVEAFAYANGIAAAGKPLTEQEKVQARYGALMQQTANVQGDFANTSDGLANSQRILDANTTNLQATIGSALLPVMAKLTGIMIPFVTFLQNNQGVMIALAAIIGVIMVGAFVAWTASIWAANMALLANPIALIILAVVALVAGLVYFFTQTEIGKKIWDALMTGIATGWERLQAVVSTVVDAISTAWNWLWKYAIEPVANYIKVRVELLGAIFTWLYDNAIKPAIDKAKTVFETLKTAFGEVHDFFDEKVTSIGDFFGGIGSTISGAFKGAFNGIAGFWNNSVGSLSFTTPDWVPGIGGKGWSVPDMPILDSGGVVSKPTIAMLSANSKPEAIVPLNRDGSIPGGTGGGNTYNIYQAMSTTSTKP